MGRTRSILAQIRSWRLGSTHSVSCLQELIVDTLYLDVDGEAKSWKLVGHADLHANIDDGILGHFLFTQVLRHSLDGTKKAS